MNKLLITSMSSACRYFFDKLSMNYEFTGWDLRNEVRRLYPPCRNSFGDTVTRRLRENRLGNNYQIICIDAPKAKYKKIKLVLQKVKTGGSPINIPPKVIKNKTTPFINGG